VALAGALLLGWRARSASCHQRVRALDVALGFLAVVAFACWWNLGNFHFPGFVHHPEFFHYYLGGKYSAELEYTGLYDCVAAAEAEENPAPRVLTRWTRDQRTNNMEQGSPAARNPSLCRTRFTPSRWNAFKHDVFWFRGQVTPIKWEQMQTDHGYNATPVWTATGHVLANTGPVSRRQIIALALIDPLLLLVMWTVVWRVFGWRTMAVALLWWGTNYPARYNYIGGAFLRQDWLILAVCGICLARRGRMTVAGAALGWSTLLRVFPGFIASGAVFRFLRRSPWREANASDALRLLAGAALATFALVTWSALADGGGVRAGIERWTGFVENSRKHLSGTATNRVSLKTALSFSSGNQLAQLQEYWIKGPGDTWQSVRRRTFEERRAVYWMVVLAFMALLVIAVRRQPYWVALVLGAGLIPIAADITCYYYGILLVYAFLVDRYPWTGVALVGLSAFTLLTTALSSSDEVRYAAISLAVVLFVFVVTGWIAWLERPTARTLIAQT
jgi:hypothetical protein